MKKLPFRNRILLLILLSVLLVGSIISGFSILYLTPPLVSSLKYNIDVNLKLASNLGVAVCENSFNYLLDLRLENDPEMNAALKKETVEEIKNISKQLHQIHMLIIEDNRTLIGSSLNLKDEKLIFPKLDIGENKITIQNFWGDPVRINYQYFPYWDWTIVSLISEADYMKPILLTKRIVYSGTLGVLIMVLFTLFLTFTLFVNIPLKRLNEATGKIADGKFKKMKVPRKDEIGQLVRSFNSMVDSLEKKDDDVTKLLEALKISEYRFRSLFENTPLGIGVASFDGEMMECNNAMLQLFGSAKSEIKQINLKGIFHSPIENEILIKEVQKKGAIYNVETKMKRNDGTIYPARLNVSQIELDDKNVLLIIAEDITDQKHLEIQLQQALKMESIGTLAGGIAHDFNNILSSIIGFTELALDDAKKGTPLEDSLQEVYTAGKRARDLVKQILTFARQSDEEAKPIQVDIIAKEVMKLIRSTIPTTIEIKQKIESNSIIMGNSIHIHQLFINLCTNAVQAMEDTGGILAIGLTDLQHNENSSLPQLGLKSGDYIKATVSDNGPGIGPEIIGSIFEPYFTTMGVGKGTGMGLAMVHGIVETYDGKITVDSELGQGTTFSIYLPVTQKSESYRQYERETLSSGTEHILFVDDELPIAKMSSQILERLGYRVTVRTSSVEALEKFRTKPDEFDLVITDMTMPNLTGDKLAIELMKIRPDIPIILCTGYSKQIADDSAGAIGIKAFVYKPVVKVDFAKTVRKVLDEAKA